MDCRPISFHKKWKGFFFFFFFWTWVALCMCLKSPHLSRVPILTQPDAERDWRPRHRGRACAVCWSCRAPAVWPPGPQDCADRGLPLTPGHLPISTGSPCCGPDAEQGRLLTGRTHRATVLGGHLYTKQASQIAPLLPVHFKGNSCLSSPKEATKSHFSNFKILDFFTFEFLSALSKVNKVDLKG